MKVTKEQILNMAINLFKRDGFEQVTIEMICSECGVTKGSFYHHFKSKNDLLLDFYDNTPNYAFSRAGELLKLSSPIEQLWRLLEYEIDKTVELGPDLLHHMLLIDIQQGNNLLNPFAFENNFKKNEKLKDYSKLFMDIIEKGQQVGEIRKGKPQDLMFSYISGLLGVAMNWSAGGGVFDEKKELYRLFRIVFI